MLSASLLQAVRSALRNQAGAMEGTTLGTPPRATIVGAADIPAAITADTAMDTTATTPDTTATTMDTTATAEGDTATTAVVGAAVVAAAVAANSAGC